MPPIQPPPNAPIWPWAESKDEADYTSGKENLLDPYRSLPFNPARRTAFRKHCITEKCDEPSRQTPLLDLRDSYHLIISEAVFQTSYAQKILESALVSDLSQVSNLKFDAPFNIPMTVGPESIRSTMGRHDWDSTPEVQHLRSQYQMSKCQTSSVASGSRPSPGASFPALQEEVDFGGDGATETQKRPFEGASLPVPKRPSPLPSATPSEASTSKKEGAHLPDIVVRIVGIAMFFLIVELKWLSAAKAEQQDGYYEFEQKDGTRRTTPLPRQSFWAAWRECVYQTLWYAYLGRHVQNRLAIAQTNEFFSRVIRIDEEVLALEVSEAWANEYRAARATTPGPSNLALRRTNQTPQPLYKRETLPLGDLIAELNASRIGPAHSLFRVDTTNSHKPDPALSGVSVDDEAFQTYSAIVYLALYLAGTYTSSSEPGLTSLPTDLSNSLHTTEAAISTQGSYALHVEKRRAHGDRYRNFKKGKQDASAGSSRPDMDPKDGSGGAGGGYEDKDGDPDHSHDDPSSSKPDSASNNEAGNGGYPRGGSRLAYESVPTGSGSRINLIPSVPPGVELGGVDEDFAEGDDLIAFGESADESEPFIAEVALLKTNLKLIPVSPSEMDGLLGLLGAAREAPSAAYSPERIKTRVTVPPDLMAWIDVPAGPLSGSSHSFSIPTPPSSPRRHASPTHLVDTDGDVSLHIETPSKSSHRQEADRTGSNFHPAA